MKLTSAHKFVDIINAFISSLTWVCRRYKILFDKCFFGLSWKVSDGFCYVVKKEFRDVSLLGVVSEHAIRLVVVDIEDGPMNTLFCTLFFIF